LATKVVAIRLLSMQTSDVDAVTNHALAFPMQSGYPPGGASRVQT
jgi:hypothetical protein